MSLDEYLKFQDVRRELQQSIQELLKAGQDLAYADHEYRKELAKKIMLLRAEGIAWTACHDLAKGDEQLSLLLLQRDLANVVYSSTQEKINVLKIEARIQENELKNTNY